MPSIYPASTNAKQFVNSLAGATVLGGDDIRAQNNAIAQHGLPVKQNIQYQNPILAALGQAGTRAKEGLASLLGQPRRLQNYVNAGSEQRDATNAQLEAFFTSGVQPENPTRDFLRAQEQFAQQGQ